MNTPPTVRLHLVAARRFTRTVILRRGPSKHRRCILWDRADDSFEDGQWLSRRIVEEDCPLSTDGTWFLDVLRNESLAGAGAGHLYTVISGPPWFTALAVFPDRAYRGMGGEFLDTRRYFVRATDRVGRLPLEQVFRVAPDADNPLGLVRRDGRVANPAPVDLAGARAGMPVPPVEGVRTEDGRLLREDGALVRDFTDMSFERLRAPCDDRAEPAEDGPDPAPWHPLDAEERDR